MSLTFESGETAYVVRLEGEVDVASAAELKRIFMEAATSKKELMLDLEHAADLDITILQLIWAAAHGQEHGKLSLGPSNELSETVHAIVRDAGFESFPGLPPPTANPDLSFMQDATSNKPPNRQ